ncbi:MAG: hypothetical protein ACPKQO_01470 [Nitrososphaeraceae archaeon]
MNNSWTLGLLVTLLIIVIATLSNSTYAQENMTDSEKPKFFAIQHSNSVSISDINETTYSLELNDVSDNTILFSDRPDRIVTSVSTSNFIGNWSSGEDSFAVDSPNAVLVVDEVDKQNTIIVELFNPVYDGDKNVLKYEAIPDNATSIDLPSEFGQTTLIIDIRCCTTHAEA